MAEEKKPGVIAEFKKFISRGNVVDMSVGVIMGSAFSAIVTAFTNILLSVCTWAVPGGLKGLVTVLPALNDAQRGMTFGSEQLQFFDASRLQELATKTAQANYADQIAANANYLVENPNLIESAKSTILSKYTLHGTQYTYNLSAVIDWGTFINAIISFLIVALTLFIIVKVFASVSAKRTAFEAAAKEKIALKKAEATENNDEAK